MTYSPHVTPHQPWPDKYVLAHPLLVYDVWKKFRESLAFLQMERISGKQQPTGLNTQFSEMPGNAMCYQSLRSAALW